MILATYATDMTRKTGKPSLPDEQRERVLGAMRRIREERFDGKGGVTRMAEALGVSQPLVSQATMPGTSYRPGFDLAQRVAKLLGQDVWELLGISGPGVDHDEYPERAKAIRAARLLGMDPRAIEKVRLAPGSKSDVDRSSWEWFREIEYAQMGRERVGVRIDVEPSEAPTRPPADARRRRPGRA